MAKNLSELDAVSTINGSDLVLVRQNGTDYKTTVANLMVHNHAGLYEYYVEKKTAYNKDFGTIAGTVSVGNHTHTGIDGAIVAISILPNMTGATGTVSIVDIGNTDKKFAHLWADEVRVGTSFLYINDKKAVSDETEVMTYSTNVNKSLSLKTTGTGITNISSEASININAPTVSISNLTAGSLTILGTTTTINTEQLTIADNIIILNSDLTLVPPSDTLSGIEINRGSSTNYQFLFRESDDNFVIGEAGTLQPVATREVTPLSEGVAIWDTATSSFKTIAQGTASNTIATGNHTHTNITVANDVSTDAVVFPTWVTANTGNLPLKVSSTKLVLNPNSGNVGIGEPVPAQKLHLNGNIQVDDASGNTGFVISYNNTTKALDFTFVGTP